MMKTTHKTLTEISNERAIANLIVSYAFANDDADIKKLGYIFKDAVFKLGGITATGQQEIEAVAGNIIKVMEDGRSSTTHEITNIMIETDEKAGSAQARSYWTLYKTVSGEPREAVLSGRYEDSFVFKSGQWAFKERVATILWKLDLSMFA
jgi:hypothetical protein